jgi:hypothetical protein
VYVISITKAAEFIKTLQVFPISARTSLRTPLGSFSGAVAACDLGIGEADSTIPDWQRRGFFERVRIADLIPRARVRSQRLAWPEPFLAIPFRDGRIQRREPSWLIWSLFVVLWLA